MLLHLKQMAGRLIRSETDRGLVVIVDARRDRGYFPRLADAFPEGVKMESAGRHALPEIVRALGLGDDVEHPLWEPCKIIDPVGSEVVDAPHLFAAEPLLPNAETMHQEIFG